MSPPENALYRFGPFFLDVQGQTLWKEGERVSLSPKLFDLLVELVSRQGTLVTREHLLATLWRDAFVEEGNLTQSVFSLRRRLGQTENGEEYIQTVPRRGYRFNVDVQVVLGGQAADRGGADAEGAVLPPVAPAVISDSSAAGTGTSARFSSQGLWRVSAAVIVFAVLFALFLRVRQPEPRTPSHYIQLTNDGLDKRGMTGGMAGPDAALATDGSRVYFTEGSSNAPHLEEVSVRGGEAVSIPSRFEMPQVFDYSLARSELLVGNFANPATAAELWAVSVPANTARRIGKVYATDGAWSPNGEEIAFVNGKSLYVASFEGTQARQIATLPGVAWRPRWSPDGRVLRLTVVDATSGAQALWEVTRDGSLQRPFTTGLSRARNECCGTWTPDGRDFLFQATRDGNTQIWSLRENSLTSLLRARSHSLVQMTTGPGNSLGAVISPDNAMMYVLEQQLHGELVRYDPSVREFLPYLGGKSLDFVEFSRDGQWMTYVTYPDGNLWRSRSDGSDPLQLTFLPMQVMVPRWSPDGALIVFHGFGGGQPSRTYVVPRDGGNPKAVPGPDGMSPNWSPDGKSILFSDFPFFGAKAEDIHVHVVDLGTGKVDTLPQSQGLISPSWSPDGRYLVAMTLEGQKIMLFDGKAGSWKYLTDGWGLAKWSHDGHTLFYLQNGSHPAIMSIRIEGGNRQVVAELKSTKLGGRLAGLQFALDPNNRPLLLRDISSQEIYAIPLEKP